MDNRPLRRTGAALAAALLAFLAAGCGGGDDDGGAATTTTTTTEASSAPEGADAEEVVAEETFLLPDGSDREVRIGVESVVVTEETMELRLVVTPLFDDDGDPVSVWEILENGTGVIPTTLIDREHLKEYTVLRDGSQRYETNPQLATATEGEPARYQRFFAAPEDDIDVIDVKVHDAWPVFEDVPLTFEEG